MPISTARQITAAAHRPASSRILAPRAIDTARLCAGSALTGWCCSARGAGDGRAARGAAAGATGGDGVGMTGAGNTEGGGGLAGRGAAAMGAAGCGTHSRAQRAQRVRLPSDSSASGTS